MPSFAPFAGATFASVGGGAIIKSTINILSEAIISANAHIIWDGNVRLLGTANVTVMGDIAGSGWIRQNPEGEEWDINKSEDWNKIN